MPSTLNGWTGASLGPSYSVVNSILSGAGGPPTAGPPAPTSAPTTTPTGTGPTGSPGHVTPPSLRPLPPVAPVNPPGFSNYSDLLTNSLLGGGPAVAGSRQGQSFTPEQAYARYLQGRAGAENTTPLTNTANLLGQGIFLPGVYGTDSNQPGQGFGFGSSQSNLGPYSHAATSILNQMMGSPQFSLAYGTPAANAPAPTPQWGYPTAYGQQASPSGWSTSQGFGSNLGGFGF